MVRLIRGIVGALVPLRDRDVVLSHFDEEFRAREIRDGAAAARRWYVAQGAASLPGAGRLRMQSWGLGRVARDFFQDGRYALRQMNRARGFTIASILMLAIGLGLVAGMYTIVNGIFIKGWDVPDNARIFKAFGRLEQTPAEGRIVDGFSLGGLKHLRTHATSADYTAYRLENFRIAMKKGERGHYVNGFYVADGFLDVLQIRLQRGAGFTRSTEAEVILSDKAWQRVFNRDPAAIGRSVVLSGQNATVVGVLEPGLEALGERLLEALVELRHAARDESACCVSLIGRRRVDMSREQVTTELQTLTSQYRAAIGQPSLVVELRSTAPGIPNDRGVGLVFALLGAGVTLVWCLTCANVGNLFLARSLRRNGEIAVRLSLGATRGRLVRQLLAEGLVLAAMAGAIAFALSAGVPLIMEQIDGTAAMFRPDFVVGAVAALGTVVTCVLVALAPALQATRIAWKSASTTSTASSRGGRDLVLAIQIAVAMVLVLSAALITRGITSAATNQADFALHETTAVTMRLTGDAVQSGPRNRSFSAAVRQWVRQANDVGLADWAPVSEHAGGPTSVTPVGSSAEFSMQILTLSPKALEVLDVPVIQGRLHSDDPVAQEAVVNERLANQLAPQGSAIGLSVKLDYNDRVYTIVGVTRDAHLLQMGRIDPLMHVNPLNTARAVLLMRPSPDLENRMTALAKTFDASASVEIVPLSQSVKSTLDDAWIGAATAGGLGVAALLLAIVGVFGVFSYLVEERRREIGVRIALGATRSQVRSALAVACRRSLLIGIGLGLVLSLTAGQLLRGFLFGLSPLDPISFAAVSLVLLLAAIAATAVPVRRALRVDPAVALRAE